MYKLMERLIAQRQDVALSELDPVFLKTSGPVLGNSEYVSPHSGNLMSSDLSLLWEMPFDLFCNGICFPISFLL